MDKLNDFNKSIEARRKTYKNEKKFRYLKKLSYAGFLESIARELAVLARKVNAKKFETSANNAHDDCALIMKNDIVDNSKNLFFALAESFKEIKENADECLGSINEALYKEKYEKVNTIDISEAIDCLNMYGKHLNNGDSEFIKNDYNDKFKRNKLILTEAAVPIMQSNTRSPLLAKSLFDAILKCINSPNQEEINKIKFLIKECKGNLIYDFKGKVKKLLNITEKVINISTRISQKEDSQSDVKGTIGMKERETLKECSRKIEKLCEGIKSDMIAYNENLEHGLSNQVEEVGKLLNNLK